MKLFAGISNLSWVSTIGQHGFSAVTADTRFSCAAPPNRAPQETPMRQGASGWVGDDMLENPIFGDLLISRHFQANLGSPNFQPWQPGEKTPPQVFSQGDLVKTFQTIYKRF